MMEDTIAQQIIGALDEFRVMMVNTYCLHEADQTEAVVQLSSQFLHQAIVLLSAVYGGKQRLVEKHLICLIVASLEDNDDELPRQG